DVAPLSFDIVDGPFIRVDALFAVHWPIERICYRRHTFCNNKRDQSLYFYQQMYNLFRKKYFYDLAKVSDRTGSCSPPPLRPLKTYIPVDPQFDLEFDHKLFASAPEHYRKFFRAISE